MNAEKHLSALLCDPGSVGEAIQETTAARAALVRVLALIPQCDGPESAHITDLLEAVRDFERETIGYLVPWAAKFAAKDDEAEQSHERAVRYGYAEASL